MIAGMTTPVSAPCLRTILVADDDPTVREVVATILRRAGHTGLAACDGDEAKRRIDPAVDLLIADLVMPPFGGLALAETLKAAAPSLQVLFMSGYGMKIPVGSDPSDDPLLQKPFGSDELLRRVAS